MNDRYNALQREAAAYARANAAEAESERLRREQSEFTGAVLCALGVNRDESVSPGNQVLAEVERLRGLLAALKANLARVVEAGDGLLFWAARFEEAGAAVAAYDDARGAAKKEEG